MFHPPRAACPKETSTIVNMVDQSCRHVRRGAGRGQITRIVLGVNRELRVDFKSGHRDGQLVERIRSCQERTICAARSCWYGQIDVQLRESLIGIAQGSHGFQKSRGSSWRRRNGEPIDVSAIGAKQESPVQCHLYHLGSKWGPDDLRKPTGRIRTVGIDMAYSACIRGNVNVCDGRRAGLGYG
jgi:hypothetical protein